MKIICSLYLLWVIAVDCFRIPHVHVRRAPTSLFSKALGQIDICAKGLELTSTLKEQIEDKIGKATKNSISDITSIHVKLKGPKIPAKGELLVLSTTFWEEAALISLFSHFTEIHTHMKMDSMVAEVTVGFKGGAVIHVHDASDHMYSSIDIVAHKLKRAVNCRHEKLIDMPIRAARRAKREEYEEMQDQFGAGLKSPPEVRPCNVDHHLVTTYPLPHFLLPTQQTDQYEDDFEEDGEMIDAGEDGGEGLLVEREKSFDMAPMSVQQASAALELIDHPFYVFRNQVRYQCCCLWRMSAHTVSVLRIPTRSTWCTAGSLEASGTSCRSTVGRSNRAAALPLSFILPIV